MGHGVGEAGLPHLAVVADRSFLPVQWGLCLAGGVVVQSRPCLGLAGKRLGAVPL